MRRYSTIFLITLAALLALAWPGDAAAADRQRCFAETGHCVAGAFLDYWERNGGLAVFGYPIGDELPNEIVEGSWVGRTQWFERDRLELHAEGVLAGRLGARALELQGRSWWDFPPAVGELPASCAYFEATRHSVCEPFLSYWRQNGGLARFGYPLSQPIAETIGGWAGTVQYFERRRMEHHAELRGTRYEVLLGLLGREVAAGAPPALCAGQIADELRATLAADQALRENLGCPAPATRDAPAVEQTYDGGVMIWADLGAGGRQIYRVWHSQYAPGRPLASQAYPDTWDASSMPADYGLTPPAGHYAPLRGFGLLWISNKFVRQDMGWPTAPERPARAVVQPFGAGATALWLSGGDTVFLIGPNGAARTLPRR